MLVLAAQATGTVDGLTDLAKQGILGLVAFLAISALLWVTKNWKKSMEDRIEDAKGYGEDLKQTNDATTNLVVETNRTSDAMKVALSELKSEVDNRRADLDGVKTEVTRLREKQSEFIAATRGTGG